jgi:two-component system NtrC family sensor kinase
MIFRSRLVWKLSVVVVAILTAAITLSGYINYLICAHYTRESARESLKFNSQSIVKGINGQMMAGGNNQESVQELIDEISRGDTVYRDIQYVSHHSGEIVASRLAAKENLSLDDPVCAVCHERADLGGDDVQPVDMLVEFPNGDRGLSVMAPIINEPRCSTAACHQHADAPPMLGFINADYSLRQVDEMATGSRNLIVVAVAAALVLSVLTLWPMFTWLLERPIRGLIAGTQKIAANQLDFRFDQKRRDEFGVLEKSFNAMTTRIQAHRDELRSAMEYLGSMVENSGDIIITVTPDGAIETFNRGAEQALGYDRIEVIGRPVEMLFADPRDREIAIARLNDASDVKNFATRMQTKKGQIRNVLLTLSQLRDHDGNSIGTIGISKDITQETELQDELRLAKEYLEGMVENSADAIITVNQEGLIETINRGGEEMLGYRREEVVGQPIGNLYVDPQERYVATARLAATGSVKNFATRLRTKDGQVRNILLTLSRMRDGEGEPIGTIGISKDVSGEKILQDELRQAKDYLEGMVENSPDIIITVSREGFIQTFNQGAEKALGYDRFEAIGRRIERLYADPRDRHKIAELLKGQGNVTNYETTLLAKDGQVLNVMLTLSHLRDRDGNAIGTIGISKDITEQKQLLKELVQSQKAAAIGQAVTAIQHAIKNMLMSLKGGSYLVQVGMKKDNQEQIEEGRLMVEDGIERIRGLSLNMLNLARNWRPELQDVGVSDLVVSICESNRQSAADHGVRLRHEVPDGLPPIVCDSKLIHMATTDLVVNAFDACKWKDYLSDETPEVVLKCCLIDDGDTFVIEVRDNGCGMTDEIKRNIFAPFFSTKKTLGTGLGLAVTSRIIKAHEGEILVESEPERGTTFVVRLPKDGPRGG